MEKAIDFAKRNIWLLLILLVGAFLRFHRIDFQSLWLDEIHTINEANPSIPFGQLYQTIMNSEQMPPLYFYTVYFLFKIFGYSTMVMRLYSAVVGIVSLYAMYVLGKEMMNKRVGLIAAFFLCVNYFHLYYSQESRPYIFLLLFTILSFYRLVVFLKNPTRRNAVIYGVLAALMIHSHFFALFALVAQYTVLLFFLVVARKEDRKPFFINALLSGIVTAVLFIPVVKILINITKIKQFWIPAPTWDSYTLIFREFFGNSEILLTLVGIFILFYFLRLSKEKELPFQYQPIVANKTVLNFIVLAPWIVIVVLIPLVRSYTSVPMLISRYFILLLPAILLLLSIALAQFRNSLVQLTFVVVFAGFSLTDIVVVKRYYKSVRKTQFREATQFIADNNKNNEPVATSLPWYFPYFLNNDKVKLTIVDRSLLDLVNDMVQDSTKRKNFWYVDAHSRPYNLPEAQQKFLDENFTVENNTDLYDIWVKHYVRQTGQVNKLDLSKYMPFQGPAGEKINAWVDSFEAKADVITAAGWAYLDGIDATNSQITPVLITNGVAYEMQRQKVQRNDVTLNAKNGFNLDNSGFTARLNSAKLPPGNYQLALLVKNTTSGKEGLQPTDKFFNKP